jgi:tubulin-specific chaperone B
MPASQYEQLSDSVLHWKRTRQLGRFDPSAKSAAQLSAERAVRDDSEIKGRGIEVGRRCRVGGEDGRRGVVGFVGAVEGLGGERERWARWVGVEFDEPVGRNDGSVTVRVSVKVGGGEEGEQEEQEERKVRLFECKPGFGVLVRPEKVEVGEEWVPLDDLEVDEDMQEL